MDRSLGIVLPAYRPDVTALAAYVRTIDETLSPAAIRIELDDPGSGEVAALAGLPAAVNVAPSRRGKGAAITAGFEQLDTDILAFVDADASTPAGSVADVLGPVLAGDADLSVGSRRHPDAGVHSHQTYVRRGLGNVFSRIARALLDVELYDYQCGAKAITREAWLTVRNYLYEPGFAWDVELIAVTSALDYAIVEVPITWEDSPGSTVSPVRDSLAFARTLMATRRRVGLLREDPTSTAADRRRRTPPPLVERLGIDDE